MITDKLTAFCFLLGVWTHFGGCVQMVGLETSSYTIKYSKQMLPVLAETTTPSKLVCSFTCSGQAECKSFHFSQSSRTCSLYNTVPDTETSGHHRKYYVRAFVKEPAIESGRSFPNHGGPIKRRRLLLAEACRKTKLSQLYLDTPEPQITTYRRLHSITLSHIKYSADLGQIFILQLEPNQIISSVLDTNKVQILRHGLYVIFAIDGRNHRLFASSENRVYSMTTKGRLYKHIYTCAGDNGVNTLAVDFNQTLFIVCSSRISHNSHVLSVRYSGEDAQEQLTINEIISALIVNPITKELLYSKGFNVVQFNPSSKAHTVLLWSHYLNNLDVDRTTIYTMSPDTLWMYDLSLGKKASVAVPPVQFWYSFCVVN